MNPEAALLLIDILENRSDLSIDHMTIIVKANGSQLHDFVYSLPNSPRLMAAKPETWKYYHPSALKVGDAVSLLCFCKIDRGFKKLMPIYVMQTKHESCALGMSRFWNRILVEEGQQSLIEKGMSDET